MFNRCVFAFSAIVSFMLLAFPPQAGALSDGYVLCGAYSGTFTILIDKDGKVAYTWRHSNLPDSLNGYSCYLLESGDLLRTAQAPTNVKVNANAAPRQGVIDRIDPDGNLVWTYTLANDSFMLHHDMKPLPNGNILAVSFAGASKASMIAAGVDSACLKIIMGGGMGGSKSILAEKIVELKPKQPSGADIVWEWKILDHVIIGDSAAAHPELFSGDISETYYYGQWVHLNGIDYCPKTDLIVFSSRLFSEAYVIDHSTTTQEAAGHTGGRHGKGGDLLYRWGKASNYKTQGGYLLDCLHCTTWIPEGYPGAGDVLFFHNNINALRSQAVEIATPHNADWNFQRTIGAPFGPEQPTWAYGPADSSFYCQFMSSALRMPNGNTLVHEAYPPDTTTPDTLIPIGGGAPKTNSRLREVNKEGQVLWEYHIDCKSQATGMGKAFNPAKIMYYPGSYIGVANLFARRTAVDRPSVNSKKHGSQVRIVQGAGRIDFMNVDGCRIRLYSPRGQKMAYAEPTTSRFSFNAKLLPTGVYCIKVVEKNLLETSTIINIMP